MVELIKKPGRLKLTDEHFEKLQIDLNRVMKANPDIVDRYERGDFPRAQAVKVLQKRFCFDVLHAANCYAIIREIYEYADDDHIYSALKVILPKVERKYD